MLCITFHYFPWFSIPLFCEWLGASLLFFLKLEHFFSLFLRNPNIISYSDCVLLLLLENMMKIVALLGLFVLAVHANNMEGGFTAQPNIEGWTSKGVAPEHLKFKMTFALNQENVKELEARLLRSSDPLDKEMYGKHMTFEEINELTAPKAENVATVVKWLISRGIAKTDMTFSPNKDFITFGVTPTEASQIVNAEYHAYSHHTHDKIIVRIAPGKAYSLPKHVAQHVAFVEPAVQFPRFKSTVKQTPPPTPQVGNGSLFVTPAFLRELYQVPEGFRGTHPDNRQGVFSCIGQYWSPSDLQEFYDIFAKKSVGQTIAKQIGANDPSNPGLEASLDVQTITTVGAGVPTWVWYESNQMKTPPFSLF